MEPDFFCWRQAKTSFYSSDCTFILYGFKSRLCFPSNEKDLVTTFTLSNHIKISPLDLETNFLRDFTCFHTPSSSSSTSCKMSKKTASRAKVFLNEVHIMPRTIGCIHHRPLGYAPEGGIIQSDPLLRFTLLTVVY